MGLGPARWRGLIADLRRALRPGGRTDVGAYVIEGTRLHERALRAGIGLRETLIGESALSDRDVRVSAVLTSLEAAGIVVIVAPDSELADLTEGRSIGPLLSLVDLPEGESLESIARRDDGSPAVILVGLEVEDPGNVGALVRTALASGAAAFAAVGITDPFHPKAVRTSMGSLFKLPVRRYASLDELTGELSGLGALRVGAVSCGGTLLPRVSLSSESVAVFVGSEAFGLPDSLELDCRVTIPMAPDVDSYSVNAAAAVLLYEILGRRREGRTRFRRGNPAACDPPDRTLG